MSAVFELIYQGEEAEYSILDFYDVSQALLGFQRSLALTTHAVLNDEVITQAPALKGARIVALPPEPGSWKITAAVIFGGHLLLQLNAIPRETPIGNIVYSAYDYVISESLGFHVDYKQTLGEQAEKLKSEGNGHRVPEQSRLDSVVEKCQNAIKDMHRPIVKSKTAERALIVTGSGSAPGLFSEALNSESFDFIDYTEEGDAPELIVGKVSSYNMNTFSGRVFDPEERRTISFLVATHLRTAKTSLTLVSSLAGNVTENELTGRVAMTVLRNRSRSGRTKSYLVVNVRPEADLL